MAEIKVGQKVRIIDASDTSLYRDGEIGYIMAVEPSGVDGYQVSFPDQNDWWWVEARRMEIVEDNQLSPNAYQHPNGVEVRSVSSTGAEKGVKASRFSLLPVEALTEVANHYGVGATKYEDHNMRRGYEWSKSYDALMRHATQFWAGEDHDEETGSKHLSAVVFHALTLMEFMETHPEFDDRYKLTK